METPGKIGTPDERFEIKLTKNIGDELDRKGFEVHGDGRVSEL
jgi:hypothetical protein